MIKNKCIIFLLICVFILVNCQSKSVKNNKSLGIILFSYSTNKIPAIGINPHASKTLNKWQIDPAYKKFVGDMNPIYWGSQDSHFETKPLFWGMLKYQNKKQYIVLDDKNQLWFDQDGEFDNIPYNLQLEMTVKSSKTNLYKTYGPYPLNTFFPLYIDDYASILEDNLEGQVKMQMAYSRIIKVNKEYSFALLELLIE